MVPDHIELYNLMRAESKQHHMSGNYICQSTFMKNDFAVGRYSLSNMRGGDPRKRWLS